MRRAEVLFHLTSTPWGKRSNETWTRSELLTHNTVAFWTANSTARTRNYNNEPQILYGIYTAVSVKMWTLDGSGVRWLEVIDFRHGQSSARLRKSQVTRWPIRTSKNGLKLRCWGTYKVVRIWDSATTWKWSLPELANCTADWPLPVVSFRVSKQNSELHLEALTATEFDKILSGNQPRQVV
jgi:hypothetical protein